MYPLCCCSRFVRRYARIDTSLKKAPKQGSLGITSRVDDPFNKTLLRVRLTICRVYFVFLFILKMVLVA